MSIDRKFGGYRMDQDGADVVCFGCKTVLIGVWDAPNTDLVQERVECAGGRQYYVLDNGDLRLLPIPT